MEFTLPSYIQLNDISSQWNPNNWSFKSLILNFESIVTSVEELLIIFLNVLKTPFSSPNTFGIFSKVTGEL